MMRLNTVPCCCGFLSVYILRFKSINLTCEACDASAFAPLNTEHYMKYIIRHAARQVFAVASFRFDTPDVRCGRVSNTEEHMHVRASM